MLLSDDRRIISNHGDILPQALWEVQAIRETEQEKLLGGRRGFRRLFVYSTKGCCPLMSLDLRGILQRDEEKRQKNRLLQAINRTAWFGGGGEI